MMISSKLYPPRPLIAFLLAIALPAACASTASPIASSPGSTAPPSVSSAGPGASSAVGAGHDGASQPATDAPLAAASMPAETAAPIVEPSAAPSAVVPDGTGALALQQQFVSVVRQVNPEVVLIETSAGLGSGVIFDSKGDIVTNAHVAGSGSTYTVTLSDGKSVAGSLVGSFALDDIAVIRIHSTGLQAATFGDSSTLQVGDLVLAVGNPLGLQSSVTEGIVSAVGRVVTEPAGQAIPNVIQTSASINPGNSGGALVDLQGDVVGIPTLAATDPQLGGSAPGIGFAISSNMAKDIATQLIQNGRVTNSHRAYLGVQLADSYGVQGAIVVAVTAGGPAAAAGIYRGDVVVSANGTPIASSADLSDVLATLDAGATIKLGLIRSDGSHATVSAVLGQYPG